MGPDPMPAAERQPATDPVTAHRDAGMLAPHPAEPAPARARWSWAALESRLAIWLLGRVLRRRGDLLSPALDGPGSRSSPRSVSLVIERRLAMPESGERPALGADPQRAGDGGTPTPLAAAPNEFLTLAVARLHARNLELQRQVQHDALTGLRSRWALDQVLDVACGGQAGAMEPCAVVFVDIDHFSSYNKHHGDDQGDQALRTVARTVLSSARCKDYVFRKGGEEMVVILPGANRQEALGVAERIRSAVERAAIPHAASPTARCITITVGVSASDDTEARNLAELMHRAAGLAMRAKLACRRNEVHAAALGQCIPEPIDPADAASSQSRLDGRPRDPALASQLD